MSNIRKDCAFTVSKKMTLHEQDKLPDLIDDQVFIFLYGYLTPSQNTR